MALPPVSIVVENLRPTDDGPGITPFAAISSLVGQDYPFEKIEIIVCQHKLDSEDLSRNRNRFPDVRFLMSPEDGYFRLKNHGIEQAGGEIIALADADCLYPPTWVSEIVATIEGGADVSVGFSNLEGGSLFRRICSYYDLHQMLLRTSRNTRRFNSSNVAFRADLIKACYYDPRFDRTGGCVELAHRLLQRGVRMQLNPVQTAVHSYYGVQRHTWKQAICEGYDFLHTRSLNREMSLAGVTRLGIFAPPFISAALVLADAVNFVQNCRLLRIGPAEVPVFAVSSLLMRTIEIGGMYWTLLSPSSIARFVGRNFA
jgi:glycosyltransferase involved in cell wall biosynthesis